MRGKEKKRFEARYGAEKKAADKAAWKKRRENNPRAAYFETDTHPNRRKQTVSDKKMFAEFM